MNSNTTQTPANATYAIRTNDGLTLLVRSDTSDNAHHAAREYLAAIDPMSTIRGYAFPAGSSDLADARAVRLTYRAA